MTADNSNFQRAKKARNDEFYTRLTDIEKELVHYKDHFKDKIVYCNCDDPRRSNFVKYLALNFEWLGLKMLRATGFTPNKGHGTEFIYAGGVKPEDLDDWIDRSTDTLLGDGSFDSDECIDNLRKADIVITNPPFSLFRDYVPMLVEHGKDFLIIGSLMGATYKETFPLIKAGEMWFGCTQPKVFDTPEGGEKKFGNIHWYTNLPHRKRSEPIPLFKRLADGDCVRFDNYDAINIDRTANIPMDCAEVMGVPVSFLQRHCNDQFEVLGFTNSGETNPGIRHPNTPHGRALLGGIEKPTRILIKHRRA